MRLRKHKTCRRHTVRTQMPRATGMRYRQDIKTAPWQRWFAASCAVDERRREELGEERCWPSCCTRPVLCIEKSAQALPTPLLMDTLSCNVCRLCRFKRFPLHVFPIPSYGTFWYIFVHPLPSSFNNFLIRHPIVSKSFLLDFPVLCGHFRINLLSYL